MKHIYTNNKKKYLSYSDIYHCIDSKDNVSFNVERFIQGASDKKNYMVLEFKHNERVIQDRQFLSRIHEHLTKSYPKAIVHDITIQPMYAPELRKHYIAVSTY